MPDGEDDPEFVLSNTMHAINGRMYGNVRSISVTYSIRVVWISWRLGVIWISLRLGVV
jgi:hypothetical protein